MTLKASIELIEFGCQQSPGSFNRFKEWICVSFALLLSRWGPQLFQMVAIYGIRKTSQINYKLTETIVGLGCILKNIKRLNGESAISGGPLLLPRSFACVPSPWSSSPQASAWARKLGDLDTARAPFRLPQVILHLQTQPDVWRCRWGIMRR